MNNGVVRTRRIFTRSQKKFKISMLLKQGDGSTQVNNMQAFYNIDLKGGFNFFHFPDAPWDADPDRKYRMVSPPIFANSSSITATCTMEWEEVWEL